MPAVRYEKNDDDDDRWKEKIFMHRENYAVLVIGLKLNFEIASQMQCSAAASSSNKTEKRVSRCASNLFFEMLISIILLPVEIYLN